MNAVSGRMTEAAETAVDMQEDSRFEAMTTKIQKRRIVEGKMPTSRSGELGSEYGIKLVFPVIALEGCILIIQFNPYRSSI